MKVIAILLLLLIFPISTFAEDIPIIKPVTKDTAQHLRIEKISMDRNLFYLMIAGDILAVILIIIILVRRFASFV
jgi:hypothetical protein